MTETLPQRGNQQQLPIIHQSEQLHVVSEISRIIERNNFMADVLEGTEFMQILAREKALRGDAKVGAVVCIDGRVGTMHVFGRTVNVWEEPASLIPVTEIGTLHSPRFSENLKATAREERDLVEIVTCHRSLTTDHHCGRVMGGQKAYEPGFNEHKSAVEVARELIIKRTVPAVEGGYKKIQVHEGKNPLKSVAVPMEVDTDTLGLELLTPDGKDGFSSTRELMKTGLREKIEHVTSEHLGGFGSHKATFTDADHFTQYYSSVIALTEVLMNDASNTFGLRKRVQSFIDTHYAGLTKDQQQAVAFTLIRSVSMQYMTGLGEVGQDGPNHHFAHHEETNRMALSLSGKTVGRFDPEEQIFGSTPSTPEEAVVDVKIKLGLLDGNPHSKKPYYLFLSEPVEMRLWKEAQIGENQTVTRTLGALHQLCDVVSGDPAIQQRIANGELVLVPVLVDENSGRVLKLMDFTL